MTKHKVTKNTLTRQARKRGGGYIKNIDVYQFYQSYKKSYFLYISSKKGPPHSDKNNHDTTTKIHNNNSNNWKHNSS